MAIRDFATHPSSAPASGTRIAVPLPITSQLASRAVSIDSVRPVKVLKSKSARRPALGVSWYEAEDRTLPSVSSF